MHKEDPPQSLQEYLQEQFKQFWITAAWLEGCLCLRCHPEGVWAYWENAPNKSWCMICGKDPLMHGPGREEFRAINRYKLYFSDNKMSGHRPNHVIFDEILGLDI